MKTIIYILITLFSITAIAQDDVNLFNENGKRDGYWAKNYKGTKLLRYEGQFDNGKEVGEFRFYKKINGESVLSAIKNFNEDNDIAEVVFVGSTGDTISKGKMRNRYYIGKWLYYHKGTNQVMTQEMYNNNGELEGERLVFYRNGQVAERANYASGQRQGLLTNYSEKGTVISKFNYLNDELHGSSKSYDASGNVIAEGVYFKDKKRGLWKYYQNGKLIRQKNFTKKSKNPYKN